MSGDTHSPPTSATVGSFFVHYIRGSHVIELLLAISIYAAMIANPTLLEACNDYNSVA